MFGYTVPLYSRLSPSSMRSYRRYYCETCHQLRSEFGLISTAAVNYDMTFNTIIMNSVTDSVQDLHITDSSLFCVFKRSGTDSEIFRKMAAYTVLLTKWELVDDELDKPSVKSAIASIALGKAISKAERQYPEYDDAVGRGFDELRRMEMSECDDPLKMGAAFGRSLSFALKDIAGTDEGLEGLFTDLTTTVYVMDAIDDLDSDFMDGTYNPLLTGYERYVNKEKFINDHMYRLTDLLNNAIGSLQQSYSAVRKNMISDTDLTDNIVYYGIPQSAKSVMNCSCIAKPSVKNACDSRLKRKAAY